MKNSRDHANLKRVLLLWAVPLLFLGFFFFYPLGAIFNLAGSAAVEEGVNLNFWLKVWRSLRFTVWQASLSTLLTLLLGLPAAYLFARFTFPGKSILRVLSTIPFILPTVVVAASFNALVGPRGWVNILLMQAFDLGSPPIQILNSLTAILLAHVFYNTSVIIRVVGSAWAQMNPRLSQAARVLGASPLQTLREVTLPVLKPALVSATLLVFLFNFTSFGVILLLGGPRFATLEVEIYLQAMYMLNLPLSGVLSAVQLVCTLILMVVSTRLSGGRDVPLSPRLQGEAQTKPEKIGQKIFVGFMIVVLIALLVSPLAALGLRSIMRFEADRGQRGDFEQGFTTTYYQELFVNRQGSLFYVPPIAAARNSLLFAGVTVLISLSLGLLASYALAGRSRVNRILEPVIMLPLGTSAVTLGLGFVVVFSRPPLDVSSFPLLIPIAHSLVAFPFVVRTLRPAISSIPPSLRQAASVLGADPGRVFTEIDLPIIARAGLVGAIFSFTISLGEFGATSFLSRPDIPTLPVAIFRYLSQPGALNYGQALAMSTILLLFTAAGILVIEKLRLPGLQEF